MIKIAIAIVFTALLAAYCIHVLFSAADQD